jgi:GTPase SAR1 family protein
MSSSRLRKIDELRARNIGRVVPLPQLVAVGDQSTGKSSLLETLTGIPFPRGQELCTRYASQWTLRRDEQLYIDITIIPGSSASPAAIKRLEAYHKRLGSNEELHDGFPSILEEVLLSVAVSTTLADHLPARSTL